VNDQAFSDGEVGSYVFKRPQRISITVSKAVFESLEKISFRDGRSLSNLASFLLEGAINDLNQRQKLD